MKHHTFFQGLRAGIPIAIGYVPIAIAFGLLAKSVGIPDQITVLLSLFVFAGASQFMAVQMAMSGVFVSEIIFTTFILNLRHFLMTASLGQRLEPASAPWRFLLAYGVTDETFSVASLQQSPVLGKRYILGLNLLAYSFWNIGTWVGLFLSSSIPSSIQQSMGIALYAMFIGLLMPSIRGSAKVLVVVLSAVAVQLLLSSIGWFSNGWRIILSTICGAAVGAFLFREEEVSHE